MPHKNEFDVTSEHITNIYDKLDEINIKVENGFKNSDERLSNIEDRGEIIEAKIDSMDKKLDYELGIIRLETKELKMMLQKLLKRELA